MIKMYEKIHKGSNVVSRLGNGAWNFEERNVLALWALTSDRDKELFPFDMRRIDWDDFARRTYLGMRKFLMNEDKDTIPSARIKLKRYSMELWVFGGISGDPERNRIFSLFYCEFGEF